MKIETFQTGRNYGTPQVLEFINDMDKEVTYMRDKSRDIEYVFDNFGFPMDGPTVLQAYDNGHGELANFPA